MTENDIDAVQKLLVVVLEKPREERRGLIESSGESAAVIDRVAELLAAYEAAEAREFLDSQDHQISLGPENRWSPGATIGPYELLSLIGRGGMGAVFRARRSDGQFSREVAIKLIAGPPPSEKTIAGFLEERQIMARLRHPNIAVLFDGDVTEQGEPYIVMEIVDGLPMDTYCDEQKLNLRHRVELFLKVCDAVQYAHDQSVIHRDLKPGNILVEKAGQPKLLDFGIAKLGNSSTEVGDSGPITRRAFTPEYGSPEQITGEPVSAASDVFSLGVILFELLTGKLPFARSRGSGVPSPVLDENQLTRPSEAYASRNAESDIEADLRGGTPRQIAAQLTGDLDAIVMKALRPEPEARYPRAVALADDLRSYLEGRPVSARKGTTAYRLGRAIRRNRAGFTALVGFILALVGTLAVFVVQNHRVAQERDNAEAVSSFLVNLFELSDPQVSSGEEISARFILDRGTTDLRHRLKDQPNLRARLLGTLGTVYEGIGIYEQAEPLFLEAHEVSQKTFGVEAPETTLALWRLGGIQRRLGKLEEANNTLREAVRRAQEHREFSLENRVSIMIEIGLTLHDQAQYEDSEAILKEAVNLLREQPRPPTDALASAIQSLAATYLAKAEQLDEAEALFREALDYHQKEHPKSPETPRALNNLGDTMRRMGRFEEAETLLSEAVESRQILLGPQHPDVAISLNNLAMVYYGQDRLDLAQDKMAEAVDILQTSLGATHPTVLTTLNNLAAVSFRRNDLVAAESSFRNLVEGRLKVLGENHPGVAQARSNLGTTLLFMGRIEEAIPYLRQALQSRREALGADHLNVAATENNLAKALLEAGNLEESESLYRSALTSRKAALPLSHPDIARSQRDLAVVLVRRGRSIEAGGLLAQARESLEASLGGDHRDTLWATFLVGWWHLRAGRLGEARPLIEETAPVVMENFPESSPPYGMAKESLGRLG